MTARGWWGSCMHSSALGRICFDESMEVPDEATARLMGAFYRELKRGSTSPERALAAAQLATKSLSRWNARYYWSGFEIFSTRLPFEAGQHEDAQSETTQARTGQ